jgi:hypothetical protein
MSPLNRQEESHQQDTLGDTEHSTMSLASSKTEGRRVGFSHVQVREYERIIGDHPDVREGVPVSIGWKFAEHSPKDINDYETSRTFKEHYHLSSAARKNILFYVYGIPEEEIRAAEIEVWRIKSFRELSAKQSKKSVKRQEFVESAKRKLKRRLSGSTRTNSMEMKMTMIPTN